jgi:hypothetical protein
MLPLSDRVFTVFTTHDVEEVRRVSEYELVVVCARGVSVAVFTVNPFVVLL